MSPSDEAAVAAESWRLAEETADVTMTLPEGFKLFLRRIPKTGPDGFRMGSRFGKDSEQPRHQVVIPYDFYLGTFPVTQEQYRAVAKAGPANRLNPTPSAFKTRGERRPVEQVNWSDAAAWCNLLTTFGKARRKGCDDVIEVQCRLPTEAEWERACRGGVDADSACWNGDGGPELFDLGWAGENWDTGMTHFVGSKIASRTHPFGLHDMYGNVWEWCQDVWDARAYRKRADGWIARAWTLEDAGEASRNAGIHCRPDSRGRGEAPTMRSVRGGSWGYSSDFCRSAAREGRRPNDSNGGRGFRVALLIVEADCAN